MPLDGSDHSLHALVVAVELAKKFEGAITLITVYSVLRSYPLSPLVGPEMDALTPSVVSELIEVTREDSARILAEGEAKATAEGVPVETLLREGHIVEEVLKTAREEQFDLIVMGARGVSRITEILLGSVSDGVMRHAPCPVLVVK